MKTELLLVIMAGVVLSLFLIVSEVAAMRKRAKALLAHLIELYRCGSILRLLLELSAIAAFFLVQPVIIGTLVAFALDGLYSGFSDMVFEQARHVVGLAP
jgi:Sec-independent protein secretion pathway component TatC